MSRSKHLPAVQPSLAWRPLGRRFASRVNVCHVISGAPRQLHAFERRWLRHLADGQLYRAVVAQQLLHRVARQLGLLAQQLQLLGVVQQRQQSGFLGAVPSDQWPRANTRPGTGLLPPLGAGVVRSALQPVMRKGTRS